MIKRHAMRILRELSKMFSSVIVTGLGQVGKTTLLQEYGKKYEYLSFDDPLLVDEFNENGKNFLENYNVPIILDEVQYVPILFNYIKILCDKLKKKGIMLMSGSQQFKMMEKVSESLAGRVGILNISTLSNREINGEEFYNEFIPTDKYLKNRKKKILDYMNSQELISNLFRISLADEKIKKEKVSNKDDATLIHNIVGQEVRNAIERVGGVLLENQPTPKKSIEEIAKEQIKKNKK